MNAADLAVETTALSRSYDGVNAVDSIDLKVPRHSVFGFLGPNGAGKTTTMKMLLGLIRPTAGSGTVFGLDIVADSSEVRRRIGYLPQEPRFYPHMTARETLRFAAGFFFSGPADRIEARVDEMLELVGIAEKADRPIKTLSGGETQRLGIAQAKIHEPDLLILDEPAAALDPLGRRDVLAILEQFRATSTVFYSTHILDDVQRVSDMVCILNKGRIISQGQIGEVLSVGTDSVFTVEIEGDVERARTALLGQAWVDQVAVEDNGASARLRVTANDANAAETRLQRVLLEDETLVVKNFAKHSANLEEVFVELVAGGSTDD
ncbi:MAG: ABC transporter ATP-binding protein [Acidimicrobiia bacterium]|nr:ABC transporter ATP-binding protein [Acidimicrobiia bacterium]